MTEQKTQCKLQPMKCPSVERTFCNRFYVYGRGRRSSSRTSHRLRLRSSPIRSLRRSSSPKKVTLRLCCSLVNALATRRLATNFFRYQADRVCVYFFQSMQSTFVERTFCNLLFVYGRGRRSSSRTSHRLRLRSSPIRSLRRSSSPKKVTRRLCCSLVNALATRRLATNFFRYQADRVCVYFFQSMQSTFVERTFCNLLYVYGRGRRRCGGPTILSDRFPLAGKHGRMPCGLSTDERNGIDIL